MATPDQPPRGAMLLALVAASTVALLSVLAQRPPPVVAVDASPEQFSAERALAVLTVLSPDERPRPVGSAEAVRFRKSLVSQLGALGFDVETQRTAVCGDGWPSCAPVENIVARWTPEGTQGPPVVLASHSDSVPVSPGAADAGVGAAALVEIGRALKSGPPPRLPVALVVTDGEEAGMLGAQAVVDAGLLPEVAAVVNLEARGTSGRSWMFETSEGGDWLVDAYADVVTHPATASVAAAVYRQMPNATDFTVFRDAGWPGVGLAYIGGGARYHTPRDDRAHLDLGSVQQIGETALALARAIDGTPHPDTRRIYFDVLGRRVITWPSGQMTPMAGGALALLLLAWTVRRQEGVLRAGAGTGLAVFAGTAAAVAIWWLMDQLAVLPGSFPATLPWGAGASAAGAVAGAVLIGGSTMSSVGPSARSAGVGLAWAAGALAVSFVEPGAAYLLTLPAAAAALGVLLPQSRVLLALPMAVATLLILPLAFALPDALGSPSVVVVGLVAALTATLLLPAMRGVGFVTVLGAALVATALGVATGIIAPYDADNPSKANVEHIQDSRGARMQVSGDPVPHGMTGGMADATLTPPRVEVLGRDAKGHTLLRLVPARPAQRLVLGLAEGATVAEVRYPGLAAAPGRASGAWTFWAVPDAGLVVAIDGSGSYQLTEIDAWLPERTRRIEERRPESAVPVQWGSVTKVSITGSL